MSAAQTWVEAVEVGFDGTYSWKCGLPKGTARWFRGVYVYRWRNGRQYTVRAPGDPVGTRLLTGWLDVWAYIVVNGERPVSPNNSPEKV